MMIVFELRSSFWQALSGDTKIHRSENGSQKVMNTRDARDEYKTSQHLQKARRKRKPIEHT